MTDRITNNAGINLAVAAWLAYDEYDYVNEPNYISVTSLLKPIKQLILSPRVPVEQAVPDVSDFIASRMGQALHSAVQTTWENNYAGALKRLGTPQKVIDSIEVNPEKPDPDKIQVYTEIRVKRVVDGITIGGKFDIVLDGRLQDIKKTSVWSYQNMKGIDDDKWRIQGSVYRWLNPDKVTYNKMYIQYILLDWQRSMKKRDPNYPPHAMPHREVVLWDTQKTEQWLRQKIAEIRKYQNAPQEDLPDCTDEDLWRSEPTYKYFAAFEPGQAIPPGTRSTKNFDELSSAMAHKASKGKGSVVVVPGRAKACAYCAASPICTQRMMLEAAGEFDD